MADWKFVTRRTKRDQRMHAFVVPNSGFAVEADPMRDARQAIHQSFEI